jgi:hypothetical protein
MTCPAIAQKDVMHELFFESPRLDLSHARRVTCRVGRALNRTLKSPFLLAAIKGNLWELLAFFGIRPVGISLFQLKARA